jgi:hypothetical protein
MILQLSVSIKGGESSFLMTADVEATNSLHLSESSGENDRLYGGISAGKGTLLA